ncbi:MAG: hypothetical protein DHS80DRAFT_25712 [Piptocephalis tieghemiana]|nr:MAG: hypothetical protein DHS80DRAFT_25712 [Piptocephalis tieghemiana]
MAKKIKSKWSEDHVTQGDRRYGTFAQKQLAKAGWQRGEGLGKEGRKGITKAIAIVQKTDQSGIGQEKGDEWGFAWWDHVYNKSCQSIQTDKNEAGEVGIKLQGPGGSEDRNAQGIISTQRPTERESISEEEKEEEENQPAPAASLLYGMFVKSTSPDGASSKEDKGKRNGKKLDYSVRITDAELLRACEGRTARKGARGNQVGKLARVDPTLLSYAQIEEEKEQGNGKGEKKKKKDKKEKKEKKSKKRKESKDKESSAEKKSKKQKRTGHE